MAFEMGRTWSEAIALVRERWLGLAIVSIGIHAIAALALIPFFSMWSELLQPGIDPQLEAARIAQSMPRFMGLSMLANLLQLAGYGSLVALLGPERPPLGKALIDGVKSTPTLLVSIVFLFVGVYLAVLVVILVLAAVIGASAATQDSVSPAMAGSAVIVFVVLYFGMLIGMVYFMARFVALLPVIVIERQYNPFAVLGRAWKLTRGHGWPIVGFFMLLWIPLSIIYTTLVLFFMWPTITSLERGAPPTLQAFLPIGILIMAMSILMAMLTSAIVVSIHGQLSEEPPAEA